MAEPGAGTTGDLAPRMTDDRQGQGNVFERPTLGRDTKHHLHEAAGHHDGRTDQMGNEEAAAAVHKSSIDVWSEGAGPSGAMAKKMVIAFARISSWKISLTVRYAALAPADVEKRRATTRWTGSARGEQARIECPRGEIEMPWLPDVDDSTHY